MWKGWRNETDGLAIYFCVLRCADYLQPAYWGVVMSEEAAPYTSDLSQTDLLSLDYDCKVRMLERVAQEILSYQIEFAKVSGRYAEIRANIEVLKQVKSALQSAIRAEA